MLNSLLLKGQLWQGNFHSAADIARARVFYENYVALAVSAGTSFSPLVWNNIALLRELCGDAAGAKTALDEVVRLSLATCGIASKAVGELSEAELAALCETNLNVTLLFNYAVLRRAPRRERAGGAAVRGGVEQRARVLRLRAARGEAAGGAWTGRGGGGKLKRCARTWRSSWRAGVGACAMA